MKTAIRSIQVLVGVLFVVSGLVKANDPLGLAYKMQEFFELWTLDLQSGHFFLKKPLLGLISFSNAHALGLSVGMITVEILAGLALLLGWMKRVLLPLLLVLIGFFTFLTAYAVLSGKFTNCGCFGDCLPIPPAASLTKDIVLLVLVIALLAGRKHLHLVARPRVRTAALLGGLALVLGLQWYVLKYLPLADCLPLKKGNNVARQMKPPPGSIPDSSVSVFVYEKDGKTFEWTPEQLPPDFETYTFKDRRDKLVRKGNAEPAIKGFSLVGSSGMDSAAAVLAMDQCFLLFALHTDDIEAWAPQVRDILATAPAPVYLVTSQTRSKTESHLAQHGLGKLPVFACDFTIIKTAARTNPTLYEWHRATVVNKWGRGSLEGLPAQWKK